MVGVGDGKRVRVAGEGVVEALAKAEKGELPRPFIPVPTGEIKH